MPVYRLSYLWLGTVITLEVAATFAWLSGVAFVCRAVAVPRPPYERA